MNRFRPTLETLETRAAAASLFSIPNISTAINNAVIGSYSTSQQSLADKIVAFAQQNKGKSVDDFSGSKYECTDLVIRALREAGAKTTYDYNVSGLTADYKWGSLAVYRNIAPRMYETMGAFGDIRAGDIIQYSGFKNSEGANYPHHSAIVEKNLGNGRIQVLEQNTNGHKYVDRNVVNLSSMTQGTIWVYHPVRK